jgi:hypothetical protein
MRFPIGKNVIPIVALVVVGLFLLTACSTSGSATPSSGTTSAPAVSGVAANAILTHSPSGTADLTWDPHTHLLAVKVALNGLAPNSIHPAHIHAGSCKSEGKVVYTLPNIVANAAGSATVSTSIKDVVDGIPATGWYVNVHNGPGLVSQMQALPIACGDVQNPNASLKTAQSVQTTLAAPFVPNEAASGIAQLTLSHQKLTVTLSMKNLAPGTTHMAHIHAGNCDSLGAVLYGLNPVKANALGEGSSTTVLNGIPALPASGWYVSVHLSTDMSTQTGSDPVACGNVILAH